MSLLDLCAKLSLDASEYESGLGNAESTASSFASAVGGGLATAAKVGATAIAAVGTAAVGATTALVAQASETAATADNIDKMSQKIGISAEAYQEWDFIMQHSGASVDSLQAGMKTLSNQIVKVTEAGTEYEKNVAELNAQLKDGTLSQEDYTKQLEKLTSDNEEAMESFEKVGISMEDLNSMSNEELFSKIITGLQGMEEGAERTALANKLLGRAGNDLGALFNTTAEETEAMRQQVHELGGVMSDEAVKSGAAFKDSLQNLQTAFSGVKNSLGAEFMPALTSVMDGLAAFISGDKNGLNGITKGITEFVNNISNKLPEIVTAVTKVGGSILSAIGEQMPTIISAVTDVLPEVVSGIAEFLVQVIVALGESAPEIVDAVFQILESLLDTLIEYGPQILEAITNTIISLLDKFTENMPAFIDKGIELILKLAEGITNALPQLIPKATDAVVQLALKLTEPDNLQRLIQAALQLMLALAQGLMEAMPQLIAAIPTICSNMIKAFIDSIPEMLDTGYQMLMGFIDGIVKSFDGLKTAMGDAIDTIFDAIGEPLKILFNVGGDIVRGLWEGIQSLSGWLWDKVTDFCGNIWDGILDFFGIASPSKEMKWVGQMIDEGMQAGIEGNAEDVVKQAEDMSQSVLDAMSFDTDEMGGYEIDMSNPSNIVVQVYGSEGQSAEEIADAVSERIAEQYNRGKAVFA